MYHHTFHVSAGGGDLSSCSPLVRVWTVVHGQLITAARQSLLLSLHSPGEDQAEPEVGLEAGIDIPGEDDHLTTNKAIPTLASEAKSPIEAGPTEALGQPFAALQSFLSASRDTLLGTTAKTTGKCGRSRGMKCAANQRSVSLSNLVLKERRAVKFNRKSTGRQSLPQVKQYTLNET